MADNKISFDNVVRNAKINADTKIICGKAGCGDSEIIRNPLTISVSEFCEITGIGKTLTYVLIKEGRLRVLKINRRTLIMMDSVQALLGNATIH